MLSPRFARQVSLNVRYWQQRTAVVDDRLLGRLDGERENLFRAVSYGLGLEATQRETAELVLQLAPAQ